MSKLPWASPHASDADVPVVDIVEKYATHSPSPAPPAHGGERVIIEHSLDDVRAALENLDKQLRRR